MAIDFDQVFKNMLAAATGQLKTGGPELQGYLQQALNNHKDILLKLAKARASNQISEADFQSELDDEKEALAGEMQGANVIAKEVAQSAANAAIGVLTAALKAAV